MKERKPVAGLSVGNIDRRVEISCVVILLLLHLLVCVHTAYSETVTHDEIWHLPVGARNLREGRFDIERVNPPLTRMWAAVPLVAAGVSVDQKTSGQELGRKFVFDHPQDFSHWYFLGRLNHLAWSVATAFIVFAWSRKLYGPVAALVSLLLYVTCPNVAAHASLVTPDAGGMFGFVATLFAISCWCDHPSWGRAVLWGILLGVAESIKFTSLLLYPLALAITFVRCWYRPAEAGRKWGTLSLQFIAAMAIGLLMIWMSYGFQNLFLPLANYQFQSSNLISIQKLLPSLPVPFPLDYVLGIDEQRFVMAQQHPVFLDGQWSVTGFRTYFLKALLYKLPHVFQLLLLIACISFVRGRPWPRNWRDVLTLLLPVAMILIVASGESLQLGLRYVLPIFPLLMIFASSAVLGFEQSSLRARRIAGTALLIVCGLSLRYQPDHLAYFNEWAGGPIGGREHLVDSNLDWGQDLNELHRYLKEQGIDTLGLAYFGRIPPQVMGIRYELPPSRQPRPGLYAVSVNFVMGRPHDVLQGDGTSRNLDIGEFSYFRFFEPVKNFGGSIDLYQISESDVEEFKRTMQEASIDHR